MDYYDISCELDKIESRIECFAEMMATLAAAESDNQPSGTYWFIHDTLKSYNEMIQNLSTKAMENHQSIRDEQIKDATIRHELVKQETKKGKKK